MKTHFSFSRDYKIHYNGRDKNARDDAGGILKDLIASEHARKKTSGSKK